MQIDDLFHSHAALQRRDGEANSLGFLTSDRLFWSALTAASATPIALSHELRTFLSLILKVAWLYIVAGARG
jgi:hypothetical protein